MLHAAGIGEHLVSSELALDTRLVGVIGHSVFQGNPSTIIINMTWELCSRTINGIESVGRWRGADSNCRSFYD